jgi:gamma-glutamylcyclotransferase (GGCT)/AIG2-like uncharacterized protein YtfP
MSKLYVAYGSNLNIIQMGWRCPDAKVVGLGKIIDYKLTFRRVATIEPEEKKEVRVAVWDVQDSDEKALDIYEGYPSLYRKEMIDVLMDNGKTIKAMVYIMNNGKPAMPSKSYLETIIRGYNDVGLDISYLTDGLQDTQDRIKN